MARVFLLLTAVFGLFPVLPLFSQTSSQSGTAQQEKRPVIRTTTREVMVDLIVRDKHHRAVTDLKPEEIEIYEDGVKQTVRSFRNIQGTEQLRSEQRAAAATASKERKESEENKNEPAALNTLRQVNFVSVVFADIGPLNLEFARRAVQEFLNSGTLPNTYVTIYKLDLTLGLIQPYTKDKALLTKAVDQAAKGLSTRTGLSSTASVVSSSLATLQATASNILANPATGPAEAQAILNLKANPVPTIAQDPLFAANAASQDPSVQLSNALLAQAALYKGLRLVSAEVNGMNATDALRTLVQSEEKLPGRKVVLYLADGLQLPLNRREVVDDLISYSNRAGVSFYTVDTRGLNVDDPVIEALAAQKRTAAESVSQKTDPHNAHFEDDDIQLTAVASTQLAMRELAESTGGFAVTNTNEIAVPMQRMMEDIRTHYELSYSPTSGVYDGHFRKIEVKVNRPKVTVQTRRGYYAVPDVDGEPLHPHELLALNAINAQPAAPAFPYEFAAMKFRPERRVVDYQLTFEIPLSALKPITDQKSGNAHFQAGLVAFVHDESGNVIAKVSRELAREATAASLSQIGNDRILYAEPVTLAPGHYLIDTAVTDEPSGKTSVKRISLFVEAANKLSLSSVEVVRHFEPLTGPRNPGSPFELENGRITPMLKPSLAKGLPVSLYFVVYPSDSNAGETPNVIVELMKDGKAIARKPLNLASRDVDGSFPMLVQLAPEAGQCDVVVTARQGTDLAQSSLSLRVE